MTRVRHILLVCLFALALSGQAVAAGPESKYYEQLFVDGRFDVTIALGFEQKKPEIPEDGIGHFFGKIWQTLNGVKRDDFYTATDVRAIDTAILGCEECGFKSAGGGKGFRLYTAQFTYEGKPVKATVKLIFSEPGVKISGLKSEFIRALGNDDAILYLGHSRHGGGIPDFASPVADTGKIFYNDTVSGWNGFNKGYFSKSRYQIFSINACKTEKYFKGPFRKYVWEKDPSKLALMLTTENTYFDDYPGTTAALIRALMMGQSKAAILQGLQDAAEAYQGAHVMEDDVKPLYVTDGFFDEAYAGKPRPKRVEPREPFSPMPL